MMDFSGLFEMQGTLFLIMLLGMFLRKKRIIHDGGKTMLSSLVIDVTLPASIIKSFEIEFNKEILISCMAVCIAAFLIQAGTAAMSSFLYPGFQGDRKKVLKYCTICSNAGILGNPIAEGIFGSLGLLYAAIYCIPQRIFMWTVGLTYFTEAPDKKTLLKKITTHPCILAVVIGLFLMIFQITPPEPLNSTIRTIGNSNTFLAMILVGTILADVRLKDLVSKDTCYYSLIRLFVIPLLVLIGCRIGHAESLVTGVCVVLSGMPAASTAAVMAAKYQTDEIFATKCVVFSTLLSMITVPLWCLFLG